MSLPKVFDENVRPADRAKGVVAYYRETVPCPRCKVPTSLVFRVMGVQAVSCTRKCLEDRVIEWRNNPTMEEV